MNPLRPARVWLPRLTDCVVVLAALSCQVGPLQALEPGTDPGATTLLALQNSMASKASPGSLPPGEVPAATEHPRLCGAPVDSTVSARFGTGWFAEETSPRGPFHWMADVGQLEITAKRAGTLVLQGHVRSFVADNALEILVDEKPVQTIALPNTDWQDLLVRIPCTPGSHQISMRSRQPGTHPPEDSRAVTICLEKFQPELTH